MTAKTRTKTAAVPAELSYSQYQLASVMGEIAKAVRPGNQRMLLLGLDVPEPRRLVRGPQLEVIADPSAQWRDAGDVQLDFPDDAFTCVAACDLLDILPEPMRVPFIDELVRVSNGHILLISPFDSRVVSTAEESVQEVYRSVFRKSDPRIAFHREQGLPSLPATLDILSVAAGQEAEVFPNTSLRSWALFEMIGLVSRTFDRGETLFSQLSKFYNERYSSADHSLPVYRHALLAAKGRRSMKTAAIRQLKARFQIDSDQPEIRAIRDLTHVFIESYADSIKPPAPTGVLSAATRQIHELERKSRMQERTIARLEEELYALKNPEKKRASLLKRIFML